MFICGRCYGVGLEGEKPCSICNGWGYLPGIYKTCPQCQGKRKDTRGYTCNICYGKGWITGTVQFQDPSMTRIPLSTVLAVLVSAKARGPIPASERTTGLAVGLLAALQQHREDEGLEEGSQLRRILTEGGWLLISLDGIWHLREGMKPTRVLVFPVQSMKS